MLSPLESFDFSFVNRPASNTEMSPTVRVLTQASIAYLDNVPLLRMFHVLLKFPFFDHELKLIVAVGLLKHCTTFNVPYGRIQVPHVASNPWVTFNDCITSFKHRFSSKYSALK